MQIALAAGGRWPAWIEAACIELTAHRRSIDESDEKIAVLECLRKIYLGLDDHDSKTMAAKVERTM